MVKPEWGVKRLCMSCNVRFYDLHKDPIICPACDTVLDLVAMNKPKRGTKAATAKKAAEKKPVAAVEEDVDPLVELEVPDEDAEVDEEDDTTVLSMDDDDDSAEPVVAKGKGSSDDEGDSSEFVAEGDLLDDTDGDDDDDDDEDGVSTGKKKKKVVIDDDEEEDDEDDDDD